MSASPSSAPSALGSLGPNVVFNDIDQDGVHDPDEDGLAGVTVNLYCENVLGEYVLTDTVLTDAAGSYVFAQVQPAPCFVSVVPEFDGNDSYVFSPVVEGGNQIFPDGTSPPADVVYNENTDGWDVGMHLPLASLGPGLVFEDLNGDGFHDEDEPAMPGVSVGLVCDDGAEDQVTTTNATGWYTFDGIFPGTCRVEVDPVSSDGNDNYVFGPVVEDGNQMDPNGASPAIVVTYGDAIPGLDAGMYLPLSSIGPNTVFNDADQDGIQDEGEEPLADVLVTLVCDGNEIASTASDVQGHYEFTGVEPGECAIQVTAPANYSFSPVVDGGNQIDPLSHSSPEVVIGYNESVSTWDVGKINMTMS